MFFLSVMQGGPSLQLEIDTLSMMFLLQFVQSIVNGCCDVIAQFILVRINIVIRFIHLNLQLERSTDVGSWGAIISAS